ncbi:hypothetical protein J4219_00970 [Candidatus Woesearchaeota archaeon]|nr:hypothetical protein [Candidatus Woesearchaeota archaeon]
MSQKIKALRPVIVNINLGNTIKLWFLAIVSVMLWISLLFASVNVLAYYIYSIKVNGIFNDETLKYAIYIVIGAYFCMILDKKKIEEALGIIKGLPFITIEQVDETPSEKRMKK